ncbi:GNAT family N-acetyltransferase [Paenibacillus cellulositrophicus]|uniref:GNAT family N-acetyltransferase n=1 Tax=Paenibacillus cellulositrophicus TaxID=562959 RepID=UPI002041385D|nr:GNAT family protein [Paenibacillus cellulositrophicus]MCM2996163.1 GNAT family N-acetyltransferase [Paenibacillus cellulositrophicus]
MPFKDAFTSFPKLETERFILRELRSEDAEAYYSYFSDHEVTKYWGYPGPKNIETASKTFTRFQNAFTRKEMITWGIATKDEDQIIGTCVLNDFVRGSMVNLSYNLSRDYWGKGIMTEVLNTIIPFAFNELDMNRIQAKVMPDNHSSVGLLSKVGFVQEGLLRDYIFGEFITDTLIFSMLKKDFITAA